MNIAPFLGLAFRELDKNMQGILNGTKIESIKETISYYAIASTLASMAAAVIPGGGGLVAALSQTGLVWATYVKINKTIGLSMSDETAKFIGNAIVTNLITNFGAIIAGHVFAGVISLIPVAGGALAAAAEGLIGYTVIYASAYIYLKLISRVARPDGTIDVADKDKTSNIIEDIMHREDMKGLIKESTKQFREAQRSGAIDAVKAMNRCPKCGTAYEDGAHFCSQCGCDLTKPNN